MSTLSSALALTFLATSAGLPGTCGTLVLRNNTWDRVKVEVRVGASTQCADNAIAGTKTLARNQRWAVVTRQVICWRREQTPNEPSGLWTPWESARLADAETRAVTL